MVAFFVKKYTRNYEKQLSPISEKELKKEVSEWAKKNLVGKKFIISKGKAGDTIFLELSWQGLKNDINEYHENYIEKLQSFYKLPEIIKRAKYILTEKDKRKRLDVLAVHKLLSNVIINNIHYDVFIVVFETSKTYLYDHILIKNKKI